MYIGQKKPVGEWKVDLVHLDGLRGQIFLDGLNFFKWVSNFKFWKFSGFLDFQGQFSTLFVVRWKIFLHIRNLRLFLAYIHFLREKISFGTGPYVKLHWNVKGDIELIGYEKHSGMTQW